MSDRRDDFDAMIETIRKTASDPDCVTVGAFATAVEKLRAELIMLESQVERIGAAVDKAFDGDGAVAAPPVEVASYNDANKP